MTLLFVQNIDGYNYDISGCIFLFFHYVGYYWSINDSNIRLVFVTGYLNTSCYEIKYARFSSRPGYRE